jgi:hypothetical protein
MSIKVIAKGRGQRAEGRREKIEGLRFQYLARVLIALATAICNPSPQKIVNISHLTPMLTLFMSTYLANDKQQTTN